MPAKNTGSTAQNILPASSTLPPTHLATVLALAATAFEEQRQTRQELSDLKQLLLDSRANELRGRNEVTDMLTFLGAQSKRAAELENARASLSRRLDSAFDSQLSEMSRLTARIEAMENSFRRPWAIRCLLAVQESWHQVTQDARMITVNDLVAYRQAALAGARFYRRLWFGTAGAILVMVVLNLILWWI